MLNDRPLVSIIIPTYNRSKILPRAVNSALNQSYKNLEVIIVDDASADNTSETVAGIKDARVRYVRHVNNMGLSAARNSGIKIARGKYINFLDDDDEIHRLKLEKQLNMFAQQAETVGIIYCGWQYVYKNKITAKHFPKHRGNTLRQLLAHCIMTPIVPLIKISCFEKAGLFDKNMKSYEDWDMWIRIARYFNFDFVPEVLATGHTHERQMSSRLRDQITAREKMLDKYRDDLLKNAFARSSHLGRLGVLYCLNNAERKGVRYIINAIMSDPLVWKNYAYLILLVLDRFKKGILEHFVTEKRGDAILYY
jgi:glycosyltransferase involved in cell wall biosynthesis